MDLTPPTVTYNDDWHRYQWEDVASEIILERFSEHHDGGLKAEVTINTNMPPTPGMLKHAQVNLLSDRTVNSLARDLSDRIGMVDWWTLLTQSFHYSVKRYREGDPPKLLHKIAAPSEDRWLLEPFVELDGATVLFAPGDHGKSYLSMCVAVAIASGQPTLGYEPTIQGPVLYLDWEASEYAHAHRLRQLTDLELPIYYRRQTASLHSSVDELRRHLTDLGAVAAIIDSVGLARGGAPESAEDTIRFFNALRKLDRPSFCVDHISKEGMRGKDTEQKMPFGSVYTQNSARLVWAGLRRSTGNGEINIHLENTKSNNGPKRTPMDVTLTFHDQKIDVSTNLNAARLVEGTQREKIAAALDGTGGLMDHEIERLTGISAHSVRTVCGRAKDWFDRVDTPKGKAWILL